MMFEKTKGIYFAAPKFIQTLGINIYELFHTALNFRSSEYVELVKLLRYTEKFNKDKFLPYQNKYLRQIVAYAYKNVPFYHNLYKKNGFDITKIKTIYDLEKLPVISKEEIRDNPLLFSTNPGPYVLSKTSGTTGKPLTIRISKTAYLINLAAAHHGRRFVWANYDGGYIARLVGDTPVKDCEEEDLYRISRISKRVIFPSYCLNFKNVAKIIDILKKMNIKYLQAYPSTAFILAKFLEIHDRKLPLKAIFYSSEPMFEFQKHLINERFDCPVFGFYGQAETAISAVECEAGNYHLTMLDGILEIEKRKECENKGSAVVTSLHNKAMPLIRYDLGDYTGYVKKECECGRLLPIIYPVETKMHGFVVTPSGFIISPSMLTFPFKCSKHIIEAQIIQKNIDKIVIKIVKDKTYSDMDECMLRSSLRSILGPEIDLQFVYVDEIFPGNSFKKHFVISYLGEKYLDNILSGHKI